MKVNKIIIGITLTLALTPFFVVNTAMAADASAGKSIYDKQCVSCHAADGKGNLDLAKALGEKELNIVSKGTKQKSDEVLLKVIAEGAGKMPANKKLTKDEQKAVLQYSRSLAK